MQHFGWDDERSRNDVSPYDFSETPSPQINRPGTHNATRMIHPCHYMHDTKVTILMCDQNDRDIVFLRRFILGTRGHRKFVRGQIVWGCPITPPQFGHLMKREKSNPKMDVKLN